VLVAYYSLSGNVDRFVRSLPFASVRITGAAPVEVDSDFVLVTPTYTDRIPAPVERFMEQALRSGHRCLGIIGSGNKNFGADYCAAAHRAARDYGTSVLHELEVWGTSDDHQTVIDIINHLAVKELA
jgi:protein involved in ribonucleotide reduction